MREKAVKNISLQNVFDSSVFFAANVIKRHSLKQKYPIQNDK